MLKNGGILYEFWGVSLLRERIKLEWTNGRMSYNLFDYWDTMQSNSPLGCLLVLSSSSPGMVSTAIHDPVSDLFIKFTQKAEKSYIN